MSNRGIYPSDVQFYWYMHKQDTPSEQELDATVIFIKWQIYRIVMRTVEQNDLEKYLGLYSLEKWYLKIRYSKDDTQENRYKIDEILD
ncbi:MAG: hypothetical protein ACD_3C00205G0016 [uncultured bacterium (gcode 4)]|uniref:Uncharacterized protein n=1 Tax=uncultured bacterium (gcode 4) TaxID=1234023 RepID=K2FWX6_9BACT|nr:MAG: hypothetical protein ACD_3C00205G0016 [uncultured bacterium (gcode 4)]